jgi:uncharacterized protein involved in outer membrane biogenesis
MKILLKISFILIVFVTLLIIATSFFLSPIIKDEIKKVVSQHTKTTVDLAEVKISPFSGKAEIIGLVIGNPEGFASTPAIKLPKIEVLVDLQTIFSEHIVIKEILVEFPQLIYEINIKGSNISKIFENIKATPELTSSQPIQTQETKKQKRKFIINHFKIKDGNILFTNYLLKDKRIIIALPDIHLQDIGKESDGDIRKIIKKTVQTLIDAVGATASGFKPSGALF